MKSIAIIPARSGSKGLRDKNIRLLDGKPLIAYTIEASLKSGMFDTVMVSTDSEKYAQIAKIYGAEVPFLRSSKTASDTASSWDVVAEVLDNYQALGKEFDTFMLLQPTSPLRTAGNIEDAYNEMKEKQAHSIVSVCEVDHSPLYCNVLPNDYSLSDFISKEIKGKRRQDIPTYYRFNGAIYLSETNYFIQNHDIYRDKCFAYVMDKARSIDIDDELDFVIAETLIKKAEDRGGII